MENQRQLRVERKVIGKIPIRVWVVVFISFTERFCFYGLTAPFQNFIQQNPSSTPSGLLGLGQTTATSITEAFSIYVKFAPLLGAVLADNWLGCYNTILVSALIYMIGAITLVVTSAPFAPPAVSLGGFTTGVLLVGLGVGGFRGAVPVFVGDQYTEPDVPILQLEGGLVAVPDRDLTLQYIFSVSYWFINIGCLSSIATTMLERRVGFWVAFLLPLCVLSIGSFVLLARGHTFVKKKPQGNSLPKAMKVLWCAACRGFNMNKAKKSSNHSNAKNFMWTDEFVEELKSGLTACRVFLAFVVLWLCLSQSNNNLISQAGQMQTHNLPNDMLPLAVTSGTILLAMPIIQKVLYPWLSKKRISFEPVLRMTVGFFIAGLSIMYAAVLQSFIYHSKPCYEKPLQCQVNGAKGHPNDISVAWQIPIYVMQAVADIFCFVTGINYAYQRAPETMKNVIMAVFMCMGAFGSLVAIAISPAAHDPYLVILFSTITAAMMATTLLFWLTFRKDDKHERITASST